MKDRQRFPIYPLLFAIYPVLFLYGRNMDLVDFSDCIKPAGILLVVTFVLLVVGKAVLRSSTKSGVLVSFTLLMFFGYGPAVDYVVSMNPPFRVGLVVFPIWCAALLLAVVATVRTRKTLFSTSQFMRVLAVALVAMAGVQVLSYRMHSGSEAERTWNQWVARSVKGENALSLKSSATAPDIYYIILDAYTGPDVLAEQFGTDITPFVESLKKQGFYVASQSACNYIKTELSLPSSLNLDYLDSLEKQSRVSARSLPGRRAMLRRPRVVQLLRDAGYKIVMIPSDYAGMQLDDPDVVLRRSKLAATEFDLMLMESSMLRVLPWWMGAGSWRAGMMGNLDCLGRVPAMKGPTFTLAHLVVTHPPFCFEADGSAPERVLSNLETLQISREEYSRRYGACIAYLNSRLQAIVRDIIARSETPPIIILQADHGAVCPFSASRGRIFNAYFLPHDGSKPLYPTITPVNTFRVIFDQYFGAHYPLLKDVSYNHTERDGLYTFHRMDPNEPICTVQHKAK